MRSTPLLLRAIFLACFSFVVSCGGDGGAEDPPATEGSSPKGGASGSMSGGSGGTEALAGSGGAAGPGTSGSAGNAGNAGNAGQGGSAGSGEAGCSAGEVDCPCLPGNTCTSGQCISGTCVDCSLGSLGCLCFSNKSCDAGLTCKAGTCVTCPEQSQGCACGVGDSCDAGLACANGVCAPPSCTEGSKDCPCFASSPACSGELYCDSNSICRACATDILGCPCSADGACTGGLVCDTGACRAARTCADLLQDGSCGEHQSCLEGDGTDAICVPETCVDGFKWDAASASCVPCFSPTCNDDAPSCNPAAPNTIADDCAAAFRACEAVSGVDQCTSCLPGTKEIDGACVPQILCGATACKPDEYCGTSAGNPACIPWPCPSTNQAAKPGSPVNPSTCQACTNSCEGPGLTGRHWPFVSSSGLCVCETRPGFFLQAGGDGQATACDADGDGWVRVEAEDKLIAADPALLANRRCQVLSVDGVLLFDEYGTSIEVASCSSSEGLVKNPTEETCTSRVPMRLLEPLRNDVPGKANGGTFAPEYDADPTAGQPGRLLQANELTALTKACVTLNADYNADGVDDVKQAQPLTPSADDQERLRSFAYFVELYTASFQPSAPDASSGKLVIQERSRCNAAFPLRYDPLVADPAAASPGDLYNPDNNSTAASTNASTYWRNCSRNRDSKFGTIFGNPGFDFAQWSCGGTGICPTIAPAHTSQQLSDSLAESPLRDHGLCELKGKSPVDHVWRGMHHHSQFKCVNLVSPPSSPKPWELSTDEIKNGKYVVNSCWAASCSGSNDPFCSPLTASGTAGSMPYATHEPRVLCTAADPTKPVPGGLGVVWAAARYQPYWNATDEAAHPDPEKSYSGASPPLPGQYERGCVNEDFEYGKYLCPYPEFIYNPGVASASFGRFSCYGRGNNFLWCNGPLCSPKWSTLFWSQGVNGTANGSVWR